MVPLPDSEVERALVIAAHPDDADFGAAGTVAAWTASGIEVSYCIVTDGDAGGFDLAVPRSEIAGIRQAEQRAAAAVVGVTDIDFLGHPDGSLAMTMELRRDISRSIRRTRPQRVLCPSPERVWTRIYASHPDHLATGQAAIAAVYPDARNPFAHPELALDGYRAWTVPEVWMMASPIPDHFHDVTEQLDKKLAALLCHVSQHIDEAAMEERVRSWMGAVAAGAGLPEGRLAEAFQVIDTA